jgi:uncharacterized protein
LYQFLRAMDRTRFVQITRQSKIAEEEFYPVMNAMYEQIWQNLWPPQIPTDYLSGAVAKSIITPADAPIPDCMTCGACCASMLCVGVRPGEQISDEDYWDITVEVENGEILVDRYLRRNGETLACAALDGTVGEQVSCRIYEQRPRICHHFEAGSDRCHAVRRAFGFEPFLTLGEMSEALEKLESLPAKSNSSETIRNVKIARQSGTDNLQIMALLKDGSLQTIHTFDPDGETWRQFEFDGLTLSQAKDLIISRKQTETDLNS